MECVYCHGRTNVVNSRKQQKTISIWRRRVCLNCGSIFTTLEKPSLDQALRVINGAGGLSPFDHNQLFIDIYLSLGHRKSPIKDASSLADTVVQKILRENRNALVTTIYIKQLTTYTLKNFDKGAHAQYTAFYPV